ncbi:hypothetical protein Trydic_g839 [Trypoxylus dichotomus]
MARPEAELVVIQQMMFVQMVVDPGQQQGFEKRADGGSLWSFISFRTRVAVRLASNLSSRFFSALFEMSSSVSVLRLKILWVTFSGRYDDQTTNWQ